ncbi:MAG: FxsA family protein [Actinomycetota bacterium]
MFPLLVVLFVLLPLAELWVIVAVADSVGIGPTLLLLLAISFAGAWMVRSQGWGALRRVQDVLGRGSLPTTELVDGALIILAGALLLTPGFITDGVGFALLIPPSRAVVRKLLAARFKDRVKIMTDVSGGRSPGRDGDVVDVDGREPGGRPSAPPPELEP